MYKLYVFVPIESKEIVKEAIFSSGGGELGNYSKCSFETKGVGQFLANKGSNPTIGNIGQIERVEEVKIEVLVDKKNLKFVIENMLKSHPYEEPAYEVVELFDTALLA